MFNLECQEKAGTVIGACVDQFLFGACCHIPNYIPSQYYDGSQEEEEPDILITTPLAALKQTAPSILPPEDGSAEIINLNNKNKTTTSSILNTKSSADFVDAATSALNNLYNVSFDASATLQPTVGSWNFSKLVVGALSTSTEFPLPNSTSPEAPVILHSYDDGSGVTTSSPVAATRTTTEYYSTRFQPRPTLPSVSDWVVPPAGSWVPAVPGPNEALGSLHSPDLPVAVGERPTPPSPSSSGSFLPLALETFSSVGDSVADRVHGNHAHVHPANGQSHLAVEPSALTVVTISSNNNDKLSGSDGKSSSVNIIKRTSTNSGGVNSDVNSFVSSSSSSGVINRNSFISSTSKYNTHRPGVPPPTTVVSGGGSSTKFSPHGHRITTESPPKLSTFMYVDGDLQDYTDATINSITESVNRYPFNEREPVTETEPTDVITITEQQQLKYPAQEKIIVGGPPSPLPSPSTSYTAELNEDLNSNTENVWTVVMQLGPHGTKDPSKPPEVISGEADEDFSHLPIIASTMHTTGSSQHHHYSPVVGPNALPLLASVLEAADAEEDLWRTTFASVDKEVQSHTLRVEDQVDLNGEDTQLHLHREQEDDEPESTENIIGNRIKLSTPKPWASSTYMIHTFQYPNVNQTYSSEEESEETTFSSNMDKIKGSENATTSSANVGGSSNSPVIQNGLMTWLSVDLHNNEVTTTEKDSPTQLPVFTPADMMKEDDSAQELMELAEGIKNSAILAQAAASTVGVYSPSSTTSQPQTTRRKTTAQTTTSKPTTTTPLSTRLPSRATTTKWKRPSQYTLPPEKKYRPTTTTTTTTTTTSTTTTTTSTTTTTTPAPERKTTPVRRVGSPATTPKPPKLITKAPTLVTRSTTPILLAEEDIDTNLDYLVDQVICRMHQCEASLGVT